VPDSTPSRRYPSPFGVIYGLYAWTLFLLFGIALVPVLLLTPALLRRRAMVRVIGRCVLRLAGMRLRVVGLDRIGTPCVVVANHASYLDGVVLQAVLPAGFSFVIKREMAAVPLAGTLLRRIGAEFVERQNRARSARDARRLLRNAERGEALVFFPEGTFGTAVGLLRFHIGAFAAAARGELPVVPVAIRGTRLCLPAGRILPHPGLIEIEVLTAISGRRAAGQHESDQAAQLRNAARAALLAALGEPDLAAAAADTGTGHA
jgi:1-acyl-sn-glycerol-3-phosphate acyltransferase